MSPEQISAGRAPLDHRTDIYSLGATLYELLTLQPPFTGQARDEVIGQILHKEPKPPRSVNRRLPKDMETICLKAMVRDPKNVAQTASFRNDGKAGHEPVNKSSSRLNRGHERERFGAIWGRKPRCRKRVLFCSTSATSPTHGLMGPSVAWQPSNARDVRQFRWIQRLLVLQTLVYRFANSVTPLSNVGRCM